MAGESGGDVTGARPTCKDVLETGDESRCGGGVTAAVTKALGLRGRRAAPAHTPWQGLSAEPRAVS